MAKPMASHTNKRIQVSSGNENIMTRQVTIPRIGTNGTNGVLNGRSASGCCLRRIKIPRQTMTKANKVPILVISPTTLIGTKPAKRLMKIQSTQFDLDGVWNFGCSCENTFGSKPSLLIE